MGLSSPGVGSGLDVNSLVTKLMDAESVPLNELKTKESSYNDKISAYGRLKSMVAMFQTAVKGLTDANLNQQTATSNNLAIAATSVTGKVTTASYNLQVSTLAQGDILGVTGFADTTSTLGQGTMSITINGNTVNVPGGNYSLQGLADAINGAGAGVSAAIVNTGIGAKPYEMVLTGNSTGAANSVAITATGGLAAFDTTTGTVTRVQSAQDASFKLNGVLLSRASNTVTDAITGVNLALTKADPATTVNIVVGNDKSAPKAAITSFVTAYNTLASTIKLMTSYDPATKTGAVLNGDSGARSLDVTLHQALTRGTTGSRFNNLSALGISFQKDGSLAVDDAKLQKALDTNYADVAKAFTATDGFGTRMTKLVDSVLGTNGVLASRTTGLQNTVKTLQNQEEALQNRLDATQKRLFRQFSALDTMLSNMQTTSSYLKQQLASLDSNK